jgi:hypothetical protein
MGPFLDQQLMRVGPRLGVIQTVQWQDNDMANNNWKDERWLESEAEVLRPEYPSA